MPLSKVTSASGAGCSERGYRDYGYCSHSRKVTGGVVCAISGYDVDGHDYIHRPLKMGLCVLVEKPMEGVPQVVVEIRAEYCPGPANFAHPSRKLRVIGIMGTKGKTTVSNLLYQAGKEAGDRVGRIGTNGVAYKEQSYELSHTTPESRDLQEILADMVEAGVKTVFLEVSSGGLKLSRVADVDFYLAIFTNFSPDHIGPKEHADLEEYLYWKSRLFAMTKVALINGDEEVADVLKKSAKGEAYFYGMEQGDFRAEHYQPGNNLREPTRFDYRGKASFPVVLSAPGRFSVYNALAVLAAGELLGYDKNALQRALEKGHVDGRIQLLPTPPTYQVVLDYAHNGLSLESILNTLRAYKPHRLLCLMGSVGGRTKLRRKELGDVAARLADVAILTSDNPDWENPMEIIEDMAESFQGSACEVYKEPDREKAVHLALSLMEEGDILLLAGKGHETYQLIDGKQVPYSDKDAVASYFR